MKTGKLPENVLKRSLLKQLNSRRKEVVQGAGVGEDCALFSFSEDSRELMVLSLSSFTIVNPCLTAYRLIAAVNNVAAGGGIPVALMVSAILPKGTTEEEIRILAVEVKKACDLLGLTAAGGDTRISPWVEKAQLTVTVLGRAKKDILPSGEYHPGQEVVMTKWLGLWGTAALALHNREILSKRLPEALLEEAEGFIQLSSVMKEAAIGLEAGVAGMHDVSRGGIFTALWELAERAGTGLEVQLKKLPIRQETVEITEVLGVNPYELFGGGSLLLVCDRGNELTARLKQEGIEAGVIGRLTADKAKVIYQQEEKRYLDRPCGADGEEEVFIKNQ